MLYLSLILLASGLFLVVSSIYFTQNKPRGIHLGDRFVPNDDFNYSMDHRLPEAESGRTDFSNHGRQAVSPEREAVGPDSPLEDFMGDGDIASEELSDEPSGILGELDDHFNDNYTEEAQAEEAPPESRPGSGRAVFFEDASGLVDYEGGESSIDPSVEAYSRLKRIGEGEVQIAGEGLVIRIGRAIHRFDFHKVRDYRIGDNFIALYPRNGKSVRLFLVDDNPELRFEIQAAVEDYFRGAG